MRVLHVSNYYKPCWEGGGVARSVYEVTQGLRGNGVDVAVATTDGVESRPDLVRNRLADVDGVEIIYYRNFSRIAGRRMLPVPLPLRALFGLPLQVRGVDIVHLHEHRTVLAWIASRAVRRHGIPYVVQPRGSLPRNIGRGRLKRWFDRWVGDRIIRNADCVLALHDEEKRKIEEQLEGVRVEVIPNSFPLNRPKGDGKHFRRKFRIPPDAMLILGLGRMSRIKGFDLLIGGFEKAGHKNSSAHLVLAGPDDEEGIRLRSQASASPFKNRIHFTGPLYDEAKWDAYAAANLFVMCSRYEIFGNTVLEALTSRTPLLVSSQCGLVGALAPAGVQIIEPESGAIAAGIAAFLSNPSAHEAAAARALGFAEETFSRDAVANRLMALYDRTLNQRGLVTDEAPPRI